MNNSEIINHIVILLIAWLVGLTRHLLVLLDLIHFGVVNLLLVHHLLLLAK